MLQKLFLKKSDRTLIHLLRLIFSSNIAFSVDFGILVLLTEVFHIHYLISAGAGFITGAGFNELFIWFFTEHLHIYSLFSKIISGFTVFFFNFFTRKYVLFR